MESETQGASGYYVWKAAGKPFEIHLSLDALDGLGAEVMRGFGLVPKRGAEVGGLLLGTLERGATTKVCVDDFEPVPCGYTRGPSYLLSDSERNTFEQAAQRWRPGESGSIYAVGYYRAHTRDGLTLAPEDVDLMNQYFPDASQVALLVKPFAMKASTGGFFFREAGTLQDTTPLEFPFRRRELTGEEPPERRPLTDRSGRANSGGTQNRSATEDLSNAAAPPLQLATPAPASSRAGTWMWFPLSFVFLLLGVALGYWAALNVGPRSLAAAASEYSLSLAVLKEEGNLLVHWNGESPAISGANRGVLEVHDGGYAKTVELDPVQLRGGKLAFHNASDMVTFHLTVYLNSRLNISETLDWHQ